MRLLLLILFSPIFLFAQSTDIDDLLEKVDELNGVEKADVLFEIGNILMDEEYDEAIINFSEAYELYEKYESKYQIHYVEAKLAYIYIKKGDFKQAEKFLKQAYPFFILMDNSTDKCALFDHMGLYYMYQYKFDLALAYFDSALTISEMFKFDEQSMTIKANSALIYLSTGKFDVALEMYYDIISLIPKDDTIGLATLYLNIGSCYHNWGFTDSALHYYEESLTINESIDNNENIAKLLNNIAVVHKQKANYEMAIEYFQKSIKVKKILGDNKGIGRSQMNIGAVFGSMGNYEKAIEIYHKSIVILNQHKEFGSLARTYNNIGNNKIELKELDSAYFYFRMSLHLRQKIQDNKGQISSLISLADLFTHEYDNIDSAYFYASKALILANETKDGYSKLLAEIVVARYYAQNMQYQKAIELLKPNIEFLEQQELHQQLAEIFEIISNAFEGLGDFKNALSFRKQYENKKSILDNIEIETRVNELQLEYGNDLRLVAKQNEIDLLAKDHELSKSKTRVLTWITFAIISILILLLVTFWFYFTSLKQKRIIRVESEKAKQLVLEKTQLENSNLEKDISLKSKELTTTAALIVQKNELLQQLKGDLDKLIVVSNEEEGLSHFLKLRRIINGSISFEKDWTNFKAQFEQVHIDFFTKLNAAFPDLTNNDIKLCSYMHMGMSNKEIAAMFNITQESLKKRRSRLRTKMNLEPNSNIMVHLNDLFI